MTAARKLERPRPGRAVRIEHLQEHVGATDCLYCRRCHTRYSVDPSDYFWARPGHVFTCCNVNNILLFREQPRTPLQHPDPNFERWRNQYRGGRRA